VVAGGDIEKEAFTDCETGVMVNSGFITGLPVEEGKVKIIEWLTAQGIGYEKVNFKLRDWVFARQRYWGEPVPIVHCPCCGIVPLPEDQLPLTLPYVEKYEQTDDGESPLALLTDWVNTTCPACGGPAKRETDIMPQWAGSSWYFLRYCDAQNPNAIASKEALDYWMPVDWYNGGMEHTTLHLLYSRFWHKFLYDEGCVPCPEPYQKRTSHGMILAENGEKMSKSRGNVVNPDEIIDQFGADTLRLYEMFIGDFEKTAPWNSASIKGCRRFLDRIWALQDSVIGGGIRSEMEGELHRTIRKVSQDTESLKHNTAIAALMSLLNAVADSGKITQAEYKIVLLLLSLFAPHIAEEIWERQRFGGRITDQKWPDWDEAKCVEATVDVLVQINGKGKARLQLPANIAQDEALNLAREAVAAQLEGKAVVKELYVPGRLVNIVIK
jgi:leucyl-tRNA synthetase